MTKRKFKRGGAKAKPEEQVAGAEVEQEVAATPDGPAKELVESQARGTSDVPVKLKAAKGDANKKGGDKEVVDFAGLIFLCNAETRKDCFKYHVLGLPADRKDIVERAEKGICLFLFDIDLKVLYGFYKARSHGGMNLVREAFRDSKSKFPAQIRFRIVKDYPPLDESVFKPVIKENYYGPSKFKCQLSLEQVGKLLELFRALPKPPKPVIEKESTSHKSSTPAGPRTGAPPQYTQALLRVPLPIELGLRSHPGYIPAHSLSYPDIGRLEADALYRQRHQVLPLQDVRADAIERRAYVGDLQDASLRQVGVSGEFGRRRFPDDLHVDERSLLLSKGSLHQDLYRDTPYQREVVYSGQDSGRTFSGTLPYKPLTTLPWGYP